MIHSNYMTRFLNKIFISGFFLILFISIPKSAFASSLYLSPGGGTIGTGGTTYVQVRLGAGGDAVNGVSAYLAYPADKLQVVSMSYGGAFNIAAEGSYGGGGIRISRGSISGVTGDVNIATIGFRGLSAGAASVSFIGGSAAPRASDSSDSLSGTRGGTYNIVQGATQSKTPTGGGGKTPAGQPIATPTPKDTLLPQITDIKVASITKNSAVISWKTDEKTDSFVEYGLEKDRYFLSKSDQVPLIEHSLKIDSNLLTPGAKINFRIVAKDQGGNISTGNNMVFQLLGYSVKLKIVDKNNKPLKNTEVTLYSDPLKAVTNEEGIASFTNVVPGKHLVVIKNKKQEATQEINVTDSVTTQELNIQTNISQGTSPIIFVIVILLILAAAGIFYRKKLLQFINRFKKTQNQTNQPTQSTTSTPDNNV